MAIIELEDLPDEVRNKIDDKVLQTMLDGLNAKALRVAPCLADSPSPELLAEAKLILLSAFQRFSEVGAGALNQMGAGPFQMSTDTRQRSGYNLWPSEISGLQDLCAGASGPAFTINMTGIPSEDAPLAGAVINAGNNPPDGEWSPERLP